MRESKGLPADLVSAHMAEMRERTGGEDADDPLVSFLYLLMRDHLPIGDVEAIALEISLDRQPTAFTNGHLARYAKDLAARLRVAKAP